MPTEPPDILDIVCNLSIFPLIFIAFFCKQELKFMKQKSRVLFFFIFLFAVGLMAADPACIRGYIMNKQGEPLAGANIIIKETLKGTASDKNGYYFLNHEAGTYTIDISYIGYERITEKITLSPGLTLKKNYSCKLKYFEIGGIVVQAEQKLIQEDAETET